MNLHIMDVIVRKVGERNSNKANRKDSSKWMVRLEWNYTYFECPSLGIQHINLTPCFSHHLANILCGTIIKLTTRSNQYSLGNMFFNVFTVRTTVNVHCLNIIYRTHFRIQMGSKKLHFKFNTINKFAACFSQQYIIHFKTLYPFYKINFVSNFSSEHKIS